MNIALYRVMPEEGWLSMEVYADELFAGFQRVSDENWQFTEHSVRRLRLLPNAGVRVLKRELSTRTLLLYLTRALVYPMKVRRVQSDLNHVLDNSYGHLVHFMDPRRTIVTSHGGTPQTWREWNREGPAMRFFDWAFSGTLKASRIIIVSEHAKGEIVQRYDYDPDRIHVVHHGIDKAFRRLSDQLRAEARARHLPADDQHLILHVGSSIARKNIETLLKAVAELRRGGLAVHLLQVGGRFAPEQRALLQGLKIEQAVTQLGPQPHTSLVDLYNAADLFVFPSLFEGFGLPLIEAMACGAPVVCSDYEVFREVCADAACFADARDEGQFSAAIAQVLTDPDRVSELRRRGLKRAGRFTWDRCAQEVLAVYRRVAESAA